MFLHQKTLAFLLFSLVVLGCAHTVEAKNLSSSKKSSVVPTETRASSVTTRTFLGTILSEDVPIPPKLEPVIPVSEKMPPIGEKSFSKLVSFGKKEIDARLKALGALAADITKAGVGTSSQSALFATLASEQRSLLQLRSKLAEARESTLSELITTIYDEHRVYGVFIPKLRHLLNIARVEEYVARLAALRVEAKFPQVRRLLESLRGTIAVSRSRIESLTPADYPVVSRSIILSGNTTLYEVRAVLERIVNLLHA